ncbi:phage holin family protein [Weissella tructae]|uniref:phage holin family protein n=1 Tax=Weissella tructae TaxID=887702 RepID=UPI003D9404EC
MSDNDLYLLGFLLIFVVGVDIVLGNLRAGYAGENNSSAGKEGIYKKSIILVSTLAMMFLMYAVHTFAESTSLIAAVSGVYVIVLMPLGYHEIQSVLANIELTYPDVHISDRLYRVYKFFNVESEVKHKENK